MRWWCQNEACYTRTLTIPSTSSHSEGLGAVPAVFTVPKRMEGEPAEGSMSFVTFPLWMGEELAKEPEVMSLTACALVQRAVLAAASVLTTQSRLSAMLGHLDKRMKSSLRSLSPIQADLKWWL